jgi:glycerol-3-phosphate acyltransferase PlsY
VAGLGTVLGHCFPVWLRFRGGKGVATAAGVVLALAPLIAALVLLVFLAVVAISRYVSLASLLAALSAPALAWWQGQVQLSQLFLVLSLLIIAKHGGNIRRLLAGQEAKVSFGKASSI